MDYNVEFKITLPEELLETFGIDEDTPFEAYFEDGCIKVRILDEDDLDIFDDEDEDDDFIVSGSRVVSGVRSTISKEKKQKESEKTETTEPNSSIIALANNPDFSVSTIAKEANRINNNKGKGEIFVYLH